MLLVSLGGILYFTVYRLPIEGLSFAQTEALASLLKLNIFRTLGFMAIIGGVITLFLYFYFQKQLTTMNTLFYRLLKDKKLLSVSSHLAEAPSFAKLSSNTDQLLQLLKSLDTLKMEKIQVESLSLKVLMNNIEEGAFIVNRSKVVTQINFEAEALLLLRPGEIVDQAISRKISNPIVLDTVDDSMKHDKKFTELEFHLKEDEPLLLDVFPIKNKFGEVLRALAIVRRAPVFADSDE